VGFLVRRDDREKTSESFPVKGDLWGGAKKKTGPTKKESSPNRRRVRGEPTVATAILGTLISNPTKKTEETTAPRRARDGMLKPSAPFVWGCPKKNGTQRARAKETIKGGYVKGGGAKTGLDAQQNIVREEWCGKVTTTGGGEKGGLSMQNTNRKGEDSSAPSGNNGPLEHIVRKQRLPEKQAPPRDFQ